MGGIMDHKKHTKKTTFQRLFSRGFTGKDMGLEHKQGKKGKKPMTEAEAEARRKRLGFGKYSKK